MIWKVGIIQTRKLATYISLTLTGQDKKEKFLLCWIGFPDEVVNWNMKRGILFLVQQKSVDKNAESLTVRHGK